MNAPYENPKRVNVSVLMHDGMQFAGYVHLHRAQRLQDLLNDPRRFIPIYSSDVDIGMKVFAKKFIVSIVEAHEPESELNSAHMRLI